MHVGISPLRPHPEISRASRDRRHIGDWGAVRDDHFRLQASTRSANVAGELSRLYRLVLVEYRGPPFAAGTGGRGRRGRQLAALSIVGRRPPIQASRQGERPTQGTATIGNATQRRAETAASARRKLETEPACGGRGAPTSAGCWPRRPGCTPTRTCLRWNDSPACLRELDALPTARDVERWAGFYQDRGRRRR